MDITDIIQLVLVVDVLLAVNIGLYYWLSRKRT